jgi:hypothetical protein
LLNSWACHSFPGSLLPTILRAPVGSPQLPWQYCASGPEHYVTPPLGKKSKRKDGKKEGIGDFSSINPYKTETVQQQQRWRRQQQQVVHHTTCISITKTNQLKLFMEMITIYCENYMKHINTVSFLMLKKIICAHSTYF